MKIDLVSDALPFDRLLVGNPASNAVDYAAGNVIETHKHKGDFKEW